MVRKRRKPIVRSIVAEMSTAKCFELDKTKTVDLEDSEGEGDGSTTKLNRAGILVCG